MCQDIALFDIACKKANKNYITKNRKLITCDMFLCNRSKRNCEIYLSAIIHHERKNDFCRNVLQFNLDIRIYLLGPHSHSGQRG